MKLSPKEIEELEAEGKLIPIARPKVDRKDTDTPLETVLNEMRQERQMILEALEQSDHIHVEMNRNDFGMVESFDIYRVKK
jgi:hypothetical protein